MKHNCLFVFTGEGEHIQVLFAQLPPPPVPVIEQEEDIDIEDIDVEFTDNDLFETDSFDDTNLFDGLDWKLYFVLNKGIIKPLKKKKKS